MNAKDAMIEQSIDTGLLEIERDMLKERVKRLEEIVRKQEDLLDEYRKLVDVLK